MLAGCRQFGAREARDLARFVEQNRGDNFPAYIALSKTCSEGAIRAAVVNMVAHRYFPDLDGSLDGEVDGEITGKWGRPKRPGAWVTDLARAYQQSGIPGVMEVLLDNLAAGISIDPEDIDGIAGARVLSFADAEYLTDDAGFEITAPDGSQLQVTILQRARPRA